MKLSTRARYGVRALADIAGQESEGPIQLKDIASRQEISLKYLEQIFAQLRAAGLVRGLRGPRGGYFLGKPPQSMTIREVVEALDGSLALVDCVDDKNACKRSKGCSARALWTQISDGLRQSLSSFSIADVGMSSARGRAPRRRPSSA